GGKPKRYVEVWQGVTLVTNVEVTKTHGDFYTNDTFAQLSWARGEDQLVYIAEASTDENDTTKFDYIPDWGERFTGYTSPTIVVVDLAAKSARTVPLDPHELSPGQVLFGPNATSLVFSGYKRCPQPLGVVYCFNRPISIYQMDLQGHNLERLTPTDQSCRSPRLAKDGSRLLYLTNVLGGPHNSCTSLAEYRWADRSVRDVVPTSMDFASNPDGFPGLYLNLLLDSPWLSDKSNDDYVVCASNWGSRSTVLLIHTFTGVVRNLTPDVSAGSWAVLDTYQNMILAARSTPNQPRTLHLAVPSPLDFESVMSWDVVRFPERLSCLEALLITPRVDVSSTRTGPLAQCVRTWRERTGFTKAPLIVFPHGGPHSVSTTDFTWLVAAYALAGFATLFTNYRGSLGFGQTHVESLVGRIGEVEVEDVQYMAEAVLRQHADQLDDQRVFYFGGSHGGFIGAHVSGRYPDFYRAVVLRNPVINVGAMAATTDIPDWCAVESGFTYSYDGYNMIHPDRFRAMFEKSPIRAADQVKAATLLLIGEGDRRVPPTDGKAWFAALRGRQDPNLVVDMKCYPKVGHALDTVEVEGSNFFHTMRFF
ncbi:Alpha/Beta hydrolase protein, partial [Dimargaris cristalligena]